MPNNVTNQLTINGSDSQVKEVLDFLKGKDSEGKEMLIDFNKIEPMPEALNLPSDADSMNAMKYLLAVQSGFRAKIALKMDSTLENLVASVEEIKATNPKRYETMIANGKQYLRNIADYGCTTWYEWRIEHWETKWNAYEASMVNDNTIEFLTAWCGVPGLMKKLATKFPDVEFEYIFADEDLGFNVGSYRIKGNNVEDDSPDDDSAGAWEIVFTLCLACPEQMHQLEDGSWEWNDD